MTVSLHTHSAYSLLDGASLPRELITRGSELGYKAMALTDHNNVSGVWEFQRLALEAGIKPIIGCEFTLFDGSHLTVLAENYLGYEKICRYLNSTHKGDNNLPTGDGIFILSGCRNGRLQRLILQKRYREALEQAQVWARFWPGRFFLELSHDQLPRTIEIFSALTEIATRLSLPTVATVDVHYAYPEKFPVHDALSCVRLGIKLNDVNPERSFNNASYLCTESELKERFGSFPKALEGAYALAEMCEVEPLRPPNLLPVWPDADEKLASIAWQGLARKYSPTNKQAPARLQHELQVIATLGYSGYFLIVYDLVSVAKKRQICYQGRGSAAGSLVSYCLDLTQVDPVAHNLVFERFLSIERSQQPDIDIDFDWQKRNELWDYLEHKYGHEFVAGICSFHCYREDMAKNDLLRIGLPDKLMPSFIESIYGLPRHIATHSSGLVISSKSLSSHVPLIKAVTGRTIISLDKDDVEEVGLVKLDLLSLRTLGALAEMDLPVKADDKATYEMISSGKTLGVFQIESPAQRSLQQRIKPQNFSDIVSSVALIRPGPIKGNMVEPFIKRQRKEEKITYLDEELKPYLEKTHGLIVFQEQVIQIATALGGFTPGESDRLRKALTQKKREVELKEFRDLFLARALDRGTSSETAEAVFDLLQSFAGYGLCEAHSASFAQTAYKTAYLRCHYPAEFFGALLNNQPLGYYPPQSVLWEAKRCGVKVIPLNINLSPLATMGKNGELCLGLNLIKGLHDPVLKAISQKRPFHSLAELDFISPAQLRPLVLAGALDSFSSSRRSLLWELWGTKSIPGDFTPWERFLREMMVLSLSPTAHAMQFYRSQLPAATLTAEKALKSPGSILFAGQILRPHRPPTKSGNPVVFFVMEDETGQVDVTYFPRGKQLPIREGGIALVSGTIDKERASNLLLNDLTYLGAPRQV
mgnify:FL=1